MRKGPELRSRLVTQLYPQKKSANHLRRQVPTDIGPPPEGRPLQTTPIFLCRSARGEPRPRRPLSRQCRQTASTDPPSTGPWDLPRQTCAQGVMAACAGVWGQLCQGCVHSESEPGGRGLRKPSFLTPSPESVIPQSPESVIPQIRKVKSQTQEPQYPQ